MNTKSIIKKIYLPCVYYILLIYVLSFWASPYPTPIFPAIKRFVVIVIFQFGIAGYLFDKPFLNEWFWKLYAVLMLWYPVWWIRKLFLWATSLNFQVSVFDVLGKFLHNIFGLICYVLLIVIVFSAYIGLYNYAFKSPDIWNKTSSLSRWLSLKFIRKSNNE